MKKLLSIVLLLSSIFIISTATKQNISYAQEINNNIITVVGYGSYEAEPDTKCIRVLSEIKSRSIEEAKTTSETNINAIKDYLTSKGFNDISTCDTFLYQHCVKNEDSVICDYTIANYISFLTDINTDIEPIINDLISLGVNEDYKAYEIVRNIEENYNKALQIAVENAKEKANTLSNKELKIISIKESRLLPRLKNNLFKAVNNNFNSNIIYAEVIVEFEEI